jgi:tetratricopeptide (TPR) repeat protein
MFQHAWLHLFGLPFIGLTGLALPQDVRAQQPARDAAPAMSRVVASIDAVLARAEPATRVSLRIPAEPLAPPTLTAELHTGHRPIRVSPSVADLLAQAQRAEAQGDLYTAWARLEQGLTMAPRHIDLLAEAAALAWRQNDTERAMHCARRALAVEPNHPDCLFTLGMSLAANGQAEEAVGVLARLDSLPEARQWRAANPDLARQVGSQVGSLRPGGGPALSAGHRVAAA